MSAEKLYYLDPYMTETFAEVIACEESKKGWSVVLDRTLFYPEGGGQPTDTGYIDDVRVTEVHERDGEIIHTCDGPLEPGKTVKLALDRERRFDHMQQHSGEHIVSGMICSAYGCDNVGFHMGADEVIIDFNAQVTPEKLAEIEEAANRYIWENHECEIFFPDEEEQKTLKYRSKKEILENLRIVSFPGADICACCGTHVRRSGEVGLVKFISLENFHDGVRIGLLAGKRAFDHLSACTAQNAMIAKDMSASALKTFSVYSKMKDDLTNEKIRASEAESRYFELYSKGFEGRENVFLVSDGLTNDALRKLAIAVSEKVSGNTAVFTGTDGNFRYAVKIKNGDYPAFLKRMNAALSGRGGGKDQFAQGSAAASKEELESFFASAEEFA